MTTTVFTIWIICVACVVLILTLHIWHTYKADLRAWWKARKTLRFVLNMIGTYLLLATVILLTAFGLIATTP